MSRLRAALARMLCGAALLIAADRAAAQEAIPTAGGARDAPVTAATDTPTPLRLGERPAYDDRGPPPGPCAALGFGPEAADGAAPNAPPDRKVHGEVFGEVGTRGYREGGAALCVPLSDRAAVAVSVDAARIGR